LPDERQAGAPALQNSENHRFCCSRDRRPRLFDLSLFVWVHFGLALCRLIAHAGELLLEFL